MGTHCIQSKIALSGETEQYSLTLEYTNQYIGGDSYTLG
jgi:hypothetical protein